MADIQINELLESTTAANSDWIAIDNGTATKKISVQNFNATGAASAAQSAAAAAQSASAALAAQTAAEQAEDDAQALITSAQTIVSDAQTYANEAATSAGTASTAANTATAQSAIATQAATQAGTYAQNVDSFAKTAKSWAVGGTGTRQGEDTDNSKYYSQQAHDSEINAAASEQAAATSESNAATSETNAAASESNAATSEANAAQSESNAYGSATSAASSAASALNSANNAATSETNAAASETNADLSSEDSEAWSVGQRNGVDVPPSDPTYHNNAKYWADVAAGGVSGVSSFNGRSGNVIPALGDYDASIVAFDNTSSSFQSTTTQDAIEEVQDNLDTLDASLKPVAKSGAYNDLTGKPTLGTAAAKNSTNAVSPGSTDLVESGAVYDIADGLNNAILGNATAIAKAYKYDDTADTAIDDADYIPFYDVSAGAMKKITKANADSVLTSEIADMNNILGAKNILINTANTLSTNGITFTVNKDKSFTVNGTATDDTVFVVSDWCKADNTENRVPSGIYEFSCKNMPKNNSFQCVMDTADAAGAYVRRIGYIADSQLTTINIDYSDYVQFYVFLYVASGTTVNNVTVYPMLRPASIQDDTYVPYSMTNREMTPYVQAISNPNLLDNPWFTVNQRGQSSYTSPNSAKYSVDRWIATRLNVNVTNDGLSIAYDASAGTFGHLSQRIEFPEQVVGKLVTLSVIIDNQIYSITGICPTKGSSGVSKVFEIGNDQIGLTVEFISTVNYPFVTVRSYSTNTHVIRAMKLELGSVSTLAMDTAPNYATELLKCQRYFYRLSQLASNTTPVGYGYNISGTDARICIPLPVAMRTTATLSYSDLSKIYVVSNGSANSPSSLSYMNLVGSSVIARAIGTGFTANHTAALILASGEYIDFSADL